MEISYLWPLLEMNLYLGVLYQTYETCNHNSDINLMGWYCRASEHLKDSQDNWITCVKLRCGDSANSSSDGSLTPPAVCNSIVLMSATLPRYRNIIRKTRGWQNTFQLSLDEDFSNRASLERCKVNTFLDSLVLEETMAVLL